MRIAGRQSAVMRRWLVVAGITLAIATAAHSRHGTSVVTAASLQTPEATLPELTQPVNDFAHVIDASSAAALEEMIRSLKNASGDVVVVATVQTIAPYGDIREYANKLFENHGRGIGDKGKDNGLLILLAVNERKVWVEVGYTLEQWVTDGFAGETSRLTWCRSSGRRLRRRTPQRGGASSRGSPRAGVVLQGAASPSRRPARRSRYRASSSCSSRFSCSAESAAVPAAASDVGGPARGAGGRAASAHSAEVEVEEAVSAVALADLAAEVAAEAVVAQAGDRRQCGERQRPERARRRERERVGVGPHAQVIDVAQAGDRRRVRRVNLQFTIRN